MQTHTTHYNTQAIKTTTAFLRQKMAIRVTCIENFNKNASYICAVSCKDENDTLEIKRSTFFTIPAEVVAAPMLNVTFSSLSRLSSVNSGAAEVPRASCPRCTISSMTLKTEVLFCKLNGYTVISVCTQSKHKTKTVYSNEGTCQIKSKMFH